MTDSSGTPVGRGRAADADSRLTTCSRPKMRTPRRQHLAAAVAPEADVGGEHTRQFLFAPLAERAARNARPAAASRRASRETSVSARRSAPLARWNSCRQFATRRLEHGGDFVVLVVEHLAQEEYGALFRRQRLEQDHERQGDRLGLRQRPLGFTPIVGDDRLRQPRSRRILRASRAPTSDDPGTAASRSSSGRPWRTEGRPAVRRREAQPRILHHVFGVGGAAEHPVRDAEERRPIRLKEIDLGHGSGCVRADPREAVVNVRIRRAPSHLGRTPSDWTATSRMEMIFAMYGATSRGSHDGTAIGFGASAASATRADDLAEARPARRRRCRRWSPAGARSSAATVALAASST